MPLEFTVHTALYLLAFMLSAVAALTAFPNRAMAGGRWLFLMAVAIAFWCAAEVVDFSTTELLWHIRAAQLSYLGATTAPVFYFLFAIEYSARWRRVPNRIVAALMAVPLVTIALAFTNQLHSWVWTSFVPYREMPHVLIYGHGPAYGVITVYSLALGAGAILLIGDTAVRSSGMFRTRSLIIVVAAMAPWLMQLLYSMSPLMVVGLDPSLSLSVTCVLVVVAIHRFRLLELVPVPREILVEEMLDGLAVVDSEMRVLELNPAAIELLGLTKQPVPGMSAADLLTSWGDKARKALSAFETGHPEIVVTPNGRHLAVNRSSVGVALSVGARGLVILRDVTAQVEAEQALQQANSELTDRIREVEQLQALLIDQATRDSLTSLNNRRHFDDELPREMARAARGSYPLSVVMFDVDDFKEINDAGGHAAGDAVLIEIANLLRQDTRQSDIVCRYGGDEFVVVMPGASSGVAVSRAQHWRRLLGQRRSAAAVGLPTISVGVATYPQHGTTAEELVVAADLAVYASKAAGRDCVSLASDLPRARLA